MLSIVPKISDAPSSKKPARGLLQKDIANTIGISLRAYQYYERGERTPDIEILEKLADYFQVSTDYLLGRTEKPAVD